MAVAYGVESGPMFAAPVWEWRLAFYGFVQRNERDRSDAHLHGRAIRWVQTTSLICL